MHDPVHRAEGKPEPQVPRSSPMGSLNKCYLTNLPNWVVLVTPYNFNSFWVLNPCSCGKGVFEYPVGFVSIVPEDCGTMCRRTSGTILLIVCLTFHII